MGAQQLHPHTCPLETGPPTSRPATGSSSQTCSCLAPQELLCSLWVPVPRWHLRGPSRAGGRRPAFVGSATEGQDCPQGRRIEATKGLQASPLRRHRLRRGRDSLRWRPHFRGPCWGNPRRSAGSPRGPQPQCGGCGTKERCQGDRGVSSPAQHMHPQVHAHASIQTYMHLRAHIHQWPWGALKGCGRGDSSPIQYPSSPCPSSEGRSWEQQGVGWA